MQPPLHLSFAPSQRSSNTLDIQFRQGQHHVETVYFHCQTKTLRRSGDVLFCLGILPAMELGVDLVISEPVDGHLLDNAHDIQTLMLEWNPWYRRIKITAKRGHSSYPQRRGTGLFFSAGVDSSYSLAMTAQRLDALVTIIGVDKGIKPELFTPVLSSNLNKAASHFDLEAIIVETNVRDLSDRMIGWLEYHGSLLSAVRHMLADHLENQIIAAGDFEEDRTRQLGSHPQLDPLFGTKKARVEHHGLIYRLSKIRKIAENNALLESLHVCFKSDANCGVCIKCTFVMESLDVIGKIDQAHSFPRDKLGLGIPEVYSEYGKRDRLQLRQAALELGGKQALIKRLDAAIEHYDNVQYFSNMVRTSEWKRWFKRLKRQMRYKFKSRMTRFVRKRVR